MKFSVIDAKSRVLILVRCSFSVVIAIFSVTSLLIIHCLYPLLPPHRSAGHDYELPNYPYDLRKKPYVIECSFK